MFTLDCHSDLAVLRVLTVDFKVDSGPEAR